jgi:voltage-gated potassium channel
MRKKSQTVYRTIAVLVFIAYIQVFEYLMLLENQPENANPITAIYWATTTIATVGYGDVVFSSQTGRLFSIVVQVLGLFLISGFLVTYIITPWMDRVIKFRVPRKVSSSMKDHIIICGYNQLVETLIDELKDQETLFVVVEDEEELVRELVYKEIPCIFGVPSDR